MVLFGQVVEEIHGHEFGWLQGAAHVRDLSSGIKESDSRGRNVGE